MNKNITVGIDVGSAYTRVVVALFEKGDPLPKIIASASVKTSGMKDGYITNPAEITKSVILCVSEAEKQTGFKLKRARISFGGYGTSSEITLGASIISKADGEVTVHDIEKALAETEKVLDKTNKRVLSKIPLGYRLDGKEVLGTPLGMHGVKLEARALYTTGIAQHVDALIEAVEDANIEVVAVVPNILAASTLTLSDKQKAVGVMLVDIGAETMSTIVYENNVPLGIHVFPIGSDDITSDIAIGLKVSLDDAEKIKLGALGQYQKRKIDDIITARLYDMYEMLDKYLKKMKRSELLPAGIVLVGGGANFPGLEEQTRDALRLPARIGFTEFFIQTKNKMRDPAWATAYGLALSQETTEDFQNKKTNSLADTFRHLIKQLLP